jgi:hypothetical protein
MASQLYEQWFRLADVKKEGSIGGGEAVKFFMLSGLSQETLGQVICSDCWCSTAPVFRLFIVFSDLGHGVKWCIQAYPATIHKCIAHCIFGSGNVILSLDAVVCFFL